PVSGALAWAAKRASGLPTGPPLRRTADFAPPHRVGRLSPLSGGRCSTGRSTAGRECGLIRDTGCRIGGRASLGLGHQVPLDHYGHSSQRSGWRRTGWTADQLAPQGGVGRRARPRRGGAARRGWLGAHPQGWRWHRRREGAFANADGGAALLLVWWHLRPW